MRWMGRLTILAAVLLISSESNSQTGSSDHFSLGVRLQDGTYRTHILSYVNGKFSENVQPGALFAPTGNGLRQIAIDRKKTKDWWEDFLLVGAANQTLRAPEIDADTTDLIRGYSKTIITFVGPNYIGVEDTSEGAAKSGISQFAYSEYRFYAMSKPNLALTIGNVIKNADQDFARAADLAYRRAPDELRPKLNPTPDYMNWTLKFTRNGWETFGRLSYLQEKDRGAYYEFPIPIKVPKELAPQTSLGTTLVSPDGTWSVIVEKDLVRLKTRGRGGMPQQQVLRLNGAEIVMTIWSRRS